MNDKNKQAPKNTSFEELSIQAKFKKLTSKHLQEYKENWLIENFLTQQSLTMIYAGASSGKSLFALYLVNFLLEKQALQKIYYCDGDNGLSTL